MGLLERLLGWQGRHFCQQCAACSARLPSASALVAHLVRKHFRGSPFPCVVLACGEMMLTVRQLREHLRQHAGELLHNCTTCGRSFSTAASLRRHALLGGSCGASSHACERCGRVFASAASLKRHARAHERARPSVCALCGTRFVVAAELYAHERSIHDVFRAFDCPACEQAFARRAALQRHLRREHGRTWHALRPGPPRMASEQCEQSEQRVEALRGPPTPPPSPPRGMDAEPSSPTPDPVPTKRVRFLCEDHLEGSDQAVEAPASVQAADAPAPVEAVEISVPAVEISVPAVEISVPAVEISVPAVEISVPAVEISVPAVEISVQATEISVQAVEAPAQAVEAPVQVQAVEAPAEAVEAPVPVQVIKAPVRVHAVEVGAATQGSQVAKRSSRRDKPRPGPAVAGGEPNSWRCTECGARFPTAKTLRGHLYRHLQMRKSRQDRFPLWAVL